MHSPDEEANRAESNKRSAVKGEKGHYVPQLQSHEQTGGQCKYRRSGGIKGCFCFRLL